MTPAIGQAAVSPGGPVPVRTRSPAAALACEAAPPPAHGQLPPNPLGDHRARAGTYARTDLGPEPAAAARARRLTRDTLARWEMRHGTSPTTRRPSPQNSLPMPSMPQFPRTEPSPPSSSPSTAAPTSSGLSSGITAPADPFLPLPVSTPRPAGDSPSSTTSLAATGDGGPPPKAAGKWSGRRCLPSPAAAARRRRRRRTAHADHPSHHDAEPRPPTTAAPASGYSFPSK
jgi:hypothetical protein